MTVEWKFNQATDKFQPVVKQSFRKNELARRAAERHLAERRQRQKEKNRADRFLKCVANACTELRKMSLKFIASN